MNFNDMPELRWHYGYPIALVVMLGLCLALYGYFRRIDWL
jgi:magnesium transporter